MIEEIRRTAERRLRQIEPLIAEAEQLHGVLDAISERANGAGGAHIARNAADSAHRTSEDTQPRAAKGANKRMILELVARHPGIRPAEIAQATGMKRSVAASTVSRLKRYGYLQEHEQGGVRLTPDRV